MLNSNARLKNYNVSSYEFNPFLNNSETEF